MELSFAGIVQVRVVCDSPDPVQACPCHATEKPVGTFVVSVTICGMQFMPPPSQVSSNEELQVPPHTMPAGLLVTVPCWKPCLTTVRLCEVALAVPAESRK